jgi:hypothetical protein
MGPELLDLEVQSLRSRAARYRKIGGLLGDTEAAAALNKLAHELDVAVEALAGARDRIATTVQGAHRLWAGLTFDIPNLRAQEVLPTSGQAATVEQWRELSRLWIEEAESVKHHPDKDLLAGRAFEIAQLAEKIARDAESKFA